MSCQPGRDLPPVDVDPVAIQQVLLNLLLNALNALSDAPDNRRLIRIEAKRADAERVLVVSVEDSGPGIPTEALPRLFEPFFTTGADGLGMGLAICRRILEAHGGSIQGENTSKGARFSFTLPLAGRGEGDG